MRCIEFPEKTAIYTHRVSYGETDAMTVLYHAEYLHIFERSRGVYSRTFGLPYKKMEELGIMLPVTDLSCRFKRPARYDDVVHVKVAITAWKNASMQFTYEMYDEKWENILATGYTVHACTTLQGKPVRIPEWIKEAFYC